MGGMGEGACAPIEPQEVLDAIRSMKNGKAPGPSQVPVDWLKALDATSIAMLADVIQRLVESFQSWITERRGIAVTSCSSAQNVSQF